MDCNEEYIEGFSRTFGERFKDLLLKAPLLINGYQSTTDHTTILTNLSIVDKKGLDFARKIKVSIYIEVTNPTLNRNIGMYNMHYWTQVQEPVRTHTNNKNKHTEHHSHNLEHLGHI